MTAANSSSIPQPPAADSRRVESRQLIDLVLEQGTGGEANAAPRSSPDLFDFSEISLAKAIDYFRSRTGREPRDKRDLIGLLSRDVAEIDNLASRQLDAVLHHEAFRQLEAAWRGVLFLVDSADDNELVKVRIMHVPKAELADDLEGAIEFDQSELFDRIYEQEYGMAGGIPFGMIVGNYEFDSSPSDIQLLKLISGVVAPAFAPFVAGAAPRMFGADVSHFSQLERVSSFEDHFNSKKLIKWNSLREMEDARYVALTLPRTIMRLPYEHDALRNDGFIYSEDTSDADLSGYVWGNAAFAFGAVAITAFVNSGWFADIRGTNRGHSWGGVVSGLPAQSFSTDNPGVAVKCSLETSVGEELEKHLSELGFIPLCDCPDTQHAAFYANQTIQKPKVYDDHIATTNARMSSMVQYMLCASRFAHYLKIIARDKLGTFETAADLESFLHTWVQAFVSQDPSGDHKTRARFPLREASIRVENRVSEPGHFHAVMHLWPQYQLDNMTASIKLETRIKKPD